MAPARWPTLRETISTRGAPGGRDRTNSRVPRGTGTPRGKTTSECPPHNKGSGISIESVAEECALRGDAATVPSRATNKTSAHLPAAACSAPLRARQATLWETWGKHHASGFP